MSCFVLDPGGSREISLCPHLPIYPLTQVHKYNVPTFFHFSITNDPLVTLHILSINMDIQLHFPTTLLKLYFSLDM
jgi:hypothetical protein